MITAQQAKDIADSLDRSADEAQRLAQLFTGDKLQVQAAADIAIAARAAVRLYEAIRRYERNWQRWQA